MKGKVIYLLMLPLLLMACKGDDSSENTLRTDAGQLPIVLRIPASDDYVTRAPGDPGEDGYAIELPTRLYLYIVTEKETGQTLLSSSTKDLTADRWQRVVSGDEACYNYNEPIRVALSEDIAPDSRKAIRVYAAVTPKDFAAIGTVGETSSEEQLRNLTFSLQADATGSYDYIRDIYATMADHTVGGNYYGTAQNPKTETPSVSLTLYHVAAKVDVIWNVATDKQSAVRMRQIGIAGLRREGCYLFRPMKNSTATTDTYRAVTTADVGSQWMGRHSFYIMPCTEDNVMPLEFHLWQDGDDSADGYKQTIHITQDETVFAPWVRQDILINKTLE